MGVQSAGLRLLGVRSATAARAVSLLDNHLPCRLVSDVGLSLDMPEVNSWCRIPRFPTVTDLERQYGGIDHLGTVTFFRDGRSAQL